MGSCVSVSEEDPGSARFRLAMGAKAGEMLAPPPAMGGAQSGNGLPAGGFDFNSMPEEAGLGLRSPRCGTKDETFFDSQECFESDCEDDFFSVNGDLTPSHGSTPIHHMVVAPIKLQQHKAVSVSDGLAEAKSEPSPRKTLAELLQETMAIEPADNEHNIVDEETEVHEKSELNKKIMDQLSNSLDGAPYLSTRNSINGERTPDGNLGNGKEKRGKAKHCCLPSLVHSLSFNDKKPPSPWRHSDG